jgi:hypothetical protein
VRLAALIDDEGEVDNPASGESNDEDEPIRGSNTLTITRPRTCMTTEVDRVVWRVHDSRSRFQDQSKTLNHTDVVCKIFPNALWSFRDPHAESCNSLIEIQSHQCAEAICVSQRKSHLFDLEKIRVAALRAEHLNFHQDPCFCFQHSLNEQRQREMQQCTNLDSLMREHPFLRLSIGAEMNDWSGPLIGLCPGTNIQKRKSRETLAVLARGPEATQAARTDQPSLVWELGRTFTRNRK